MAANKVLILFFIPFLIFPSLFIFGGAWFLSENMSLMEEGITVEGKVVEVNSRRDSDGDNIYYPVAEYTSESGEVLTKELNYGTSPASYAVGDPISIIYRKEKPDDLYINSNFWMYFFPGLFMGMGMLFELMAVGFFIKMLKSNKLQTSTNQNINTNSNTEEIEKPIYTKPTNDNKDKGNPFLMK